MPVTRRQRLAQQRRKLGTVLTEEPDVITLILPLLEDPIPLLLTSKRTYGQHAVVAWLATQYNDLSRQIPKEMPMDPEPAVIGMVDNIDKCLVDGTITMSHLPKRVCEQYLYIKDYKLQRAIKERVEPQMKKLEPMAKRSWWSCVDAGTLQIGEMVTRPCCIPLLLGIPSEHAGRSDANWSDLIYRAPECFS